MTAEISSTLDAFQADYCAVTGRAFRHFFCPILWRDDPVDLCQGHVINEAFSGSDRSVVPQRRDVDNFFGSFFEAKFVLLQHRGQYNPAEILLNRRLSRKLRPRLSANGVPVDHYLPDGPVPPVHSELLVEREGIPPARLAIKLAPNETLTSVGADWEITLDRDLRLPALVSLLKAAHLTMFKLMGYSYALSAAGRFVGWDVLGRFVIANMGGDRSTVLRNASAHFIEFVNLVRPVTSKPTGLAGTITDSRLFLCTGSPKPWAFMVFVRTGRAMHAVVLPVMEDDDGAVRFLHFLKNPSQRFEATLAQFAGGSWEVAKDGRMIDWPNAGFDNSAVRTV